MPRKPTITFAELADKHMTIKGTVYSPGTVRLYRSQLGKWILPKWGEMKIGYIEDNPELAALWWVELLGSTGEVNAVHVFASFRAILTTGLRFRLISSNPAALVEGTTRDRSKPRPSFTVEQFYKVLDHVQEPYRDPLQTVVGAALRLGEVCGLNRADWNPATGSLQVVRQYKYGELRQPKNGHGGVIYPMSIATDVLDRVVAEPRIRQPADDPMFLGERGYGRLDPSRLQREWVRARRWAKLNDFHLHDLRHLSLNVYSEHNSRLADIADFGRHRDLASAKRYQHESPNDVRREQARRASAAFYRPEQAS